MDKDIAVLIIHALIKQLGMHRAGSRLRKKTCERKSYREGGSNQRRTEVRIGD